LSEISASSCNASQRAVTDWLVHNGSTPLPRAVTNWFNVTTGHLMGPLWQINGTLTVAMLEKP